MWNRLRNFALNVAWVGWLATAANAQSEIWPVWQYDGPIASPDRQIAARSDGGVVIANRGPGAELRALDKLGRLLWTTPLTSAEIRGVCELNNGDIAVLQHVPNTPFIATNYRVTRFSSDGAQLATASYGGPGSDSAYAIASHPSGGYVVSGRTSDGYGTPLPQPAIPWDGGFVALHDANGNEVWVRRIDHGGRNLIFASVVVEPQGNTSAYGYTNTDGSDNPRLASAQLDSNGAVISTSFSSAGYYTWAARASDASVFTHLTLISDPPTGVLARQLPSGGSQSWILFGGRFHAAVNDGQGGIFAWVSDDFSSAGPFVGVVHYNQAGLELGRRAEARAVRSAAHLPFDEIVTSSEGSTVSLQRFSRGDLGAPGCVGQPNSTGVPSTLRVAGSAHVSDNALVLFANDLPANVNTMCVVSRNTASVPNFAGGLGTMCLGAPLARFAGGASSSSGVAAYSFNLLATPGPFGPQPALPGDTWRFQVWHRDVVAGASQTNLSSSVSVTIP